MANMFRELGLTFVPIFVAMDSVGNLPIVLSLMQEVKAPERSRIVRLAVITGLALGLVFVGVGKAIFLLLGIQVADFLVAGGVILFALAIKDLVTGKMVETQGFPITTVGAVPLGTPLVVGPAVLSTLLVLIDQYFIAIVILSFILNLAITWVLFTYVSRIMRLLGATGTKAISKVVMLLLAAIAVKMIHQGIVSMGG